MELTFVVVEDLDFYIDLFDIAKSGRKPSTRDWYSKVLRYYKESIAHLGPAWPPTLKHLDAFFGDLNARGLSDSSRNNYYRAMSAFFTWCVQRGYLPENPIRYIDKPRAPRRLPRGVPKSDIERLCSLLLGKAEKKWNNMRDLAIFSLAFDTGIRIGEIARLMVDDVDLLYQQIYVYSDKDYEDRILVMSDAAAANLAAWMATRIELDVPNDVRNLFVSQWYNTGLGPMRHWGMRSRISDWQRKAGIRHFQFNALRHSYAIESLRNGADLLDIRDQMGHASVKTTAIYTEVVNEGRNERHQQSSPLGNLRQFRKD